MHAEPFPFLTAGRRVRIKAGPFEGMEGILVRRKGKLRLVLSIDVILRAIAVDVDVVDVEPAVQSGPL
jgi:transcription antitermination factor NusG